MGSLRRNGIITQSTGGPYTPVKASVPYVWKNNMGTLSGPIMASARHTLPQTAQKVYQDDGGVFTDYSTASDNNTTDDVIILPAVEAVNDACYFGTNPSDWGAVQFMEITFRVTTPGVGTGVAWEYYNGSTWTALAVTDGTSGFTAAAGIQKVTFTMPTDWAKVAINGTTTYWVRARCTAALYTTTPKATRVWIFGDGDELDTFLVCDGTETMLAIGTITDTICGKWDLYINGVLDSSAYDDYNASTADKSRTITLTQSLQKGYNTIRMVVNGKNASSTDYELQVYGIAAI